MNQPRDEHPVEDLCSTVNSISHSYLWRTPVKHLFLVVFLAASAAIGHAAGPKQKAKDAEEQCRAVLDKNFQAVNAEDIKALVATTSSQSGPKEQMAEFRKEAEQMFADTDVYMRLVWFKAYAYKPPYMEAYVIQLTLPKNEDDHYPTEQGELNFRHHSGLLPEHQLVMYRQKFHYDRGKWRVHAVLSAPKPVDEDVPEKLDEAFAKVEAAGIDTNLDSCPNGQCQLPAVSDVLSR